MGPPAQRPSPARDEGGVRADRTPLGRRDGPVPDQGDGRDRDRGKADLVRVPPSLQAKFDRIVARGTDCRSGHPSLESAWAGKRGRKMRRIEKNFPAATE